MKRLLYLFTLIAPLSLLSHFAIGQCDINTGCAGAPILTIDPPTFDSGTLSINLDNITFGEFECATVAQSGVAVYIYQLLPDGTRMEACNVINPAPFNVVGSVALSFGPTSFCNLGTINLGTVTVGPDEGFIACDGALLELEAVLFITDNTTFDAATESVYSGLNANEFISVDLGTLNINIFNEFPGGGLPLTSANVTDLASGADGPIAANCGEDVSLYVEGLSRLANCPDAFGDYSNLTEGIASELSNEFYYTINGGAPIIIQDASTGAAGGQLTGPDPALGDNCYAGILGPYTLEWADLPADLCDGSTVVVTITTTDVFTGQTLSDDIIINYTGGACTTCNNPGCTDPCDPAFDPASTDDTLCVGYSTDCNTDCALGPFGGTWDAATCACINETTPINGCTDATACNFDAAANCDDGTLCVFATGCDVCDGNGGVTDNPEPGDACDDGDANTINDVTQADCSCVGETPGVTGCTDPNASNYEATATDEDGSCLYLCNENNLLDVSTNTGFDDGSGLSYGSPTGMGLLNGANDAFGGFIWDANTAGLTVDQICMFIDFDVTGDATAFPITLEFRIENGNCGFFPCPWTDFNIVITGPGMYTLGGLLSSGNAGANGPFDPNGPDTFIVAAIANFSGTPLAGDINVVFSNLCISDGNCVVVVDGCTDSTACNYNPDATNDDGSCLPVPTCNIDICAGDTEIIDPNDPCVCITDVVQVLGCTDVAFCEYNPAANCDDNSCVTINQDPGCDDGDCTNGFESWDAVNCVCITTPPTGVDGCTDANFCEYDPTATCDDNSCVTQLPTAATISGGPFSFCVGDGTPDFVSGITVSGGTGTNNAWVITDDQLNILGLPGMPGEVDFDGAGLGTCLIWYLYFEDDLTGAEVGMNAGNLGGCFALSNSIEVIREDCGPCEEEITGAVVGAEEGCDVSGITITIITPDGTMINVVTGIDGTFSVPGGPFPCGTYTAAFFDLAEVPFCYSETGSTEPASFIIDGNDDGNVDVAFLANPNIPTLSQWGLIVLALLLMCIGSVSLMQRRVRENRLS